MDASFALLSVAGPVLVFEIMLFTLYTLLVRQFDTFPIWLFVVAVALCVLWVAVELRSASPLVDMSMMRLRGVWTTNLSGLLLGFGMYSSFVLIPQFVQTPLTTGYGFGSSVTAAGLFGYLFWASVVNYWQKA